MKEIRKPFRHGYYEISNLGIAYRVKAGMGATAGKILKSHPDKDGYLIIQTHYHGRYRNHKIHQLVAAAFIGPCPEGMEVHHKDEVKTNCRWDNLEYKTKGSHRLHHTRKGMYKGENNGGAKLTQEDVDEIRQLYATGKYHKYSKTLAVKFSVSQMTIWKIVSNRMWKEHQKCGR